MLPAKMGKRHREHARVEVFRCTETDGTSHLGIAQNAFCFTVESENAASVTEKDLALVG